jgi:Zn ribbon nucleic-acid-binding protein
MTIDGLQISVNGMVIFEGFKVNHEELGAALDKLKIYRKEDGVEIKTCVSCKYYQGTILGAIFGHLRFSEVCNHKKCVDEVSGKPRPCETMRINPCERNASFWEAR